jgi:hypothetical protein
MSNIYYNAKQKQESDYDFWIELCQLSSRSELGTQQNSLSQVVLVGTSVQFNSIKIWHSEAQ